METTNTDNLVHDKKPKLLQKSYERLCIIKSEKSSKTLAFLNVEQTSLLIYKINPVTSEIIEKNLKQYGIDPKKILSVYVKESTIKSLKQVRTLFPLMHTLTIYNNTIQALDLINEKNKDITITIESNIISHDAAQELKELENNFLDKLIQGNNITEN